MLPPEVPATTPESPDESAATRFLHALWPTPVGDLVLWWKDKAGANSSAWMTIESAHEYLHLAASRDVYFSVCSQDWELASAEAAQRGITPAKACVRGYGVSAAGVPALWLDIDCAEGAHSARDLPTLDQALEFLGESLPQPSAIIRSGGGLHVYWFLDRPIELSDPDTRDEAGQRVADFQAHVRAMFSERGWKLDSTADLPRVLRLPGTLNHKYAPPRPVELQELHPDVRYSVDDLDFGPPPSAGVQEPKERQERQASEESDSVHDNDLELIVNGCAWMRHCRDDAENLPEPEWHAALSIIGLCEGGGEAAQEWSRPHPGYCAEKTNKKLLLAVASAGPRTCKNIEEKLGCTLCSGCEFRGVVQSPIVLGKKGGLLESRAIVRDALKNLEVGDLESLYQLELLDAANVARRLDPVLFTQLLADIRSSELRLGEWKDAFSTRNKARRADQSRIRRENSAFPAIERNHRQLRDVIAEAQEVLCKSNNEDPRFLILGDALVKVHHSSRGVVTGAVTLEYLFGELARIADWIEIAEDGEHDTKPDRDVTRDLIERPPADIPVLNGIARMPVFDKSGRLIQTEGYDAASGFYIDLVGLPAITVPESPTPCQVGAAIDLIDTELLHDVQFDSHADRAHYYGALLTPIVRLLFEGQIPLHLFEAPTPGAGKGLLCNCLGIVTTGHRPFAQPIASDDDEMRKRITAQLLSGSEVVLLDNAPEGKILDSASLASVLTTSSWTDRILGLTRMVHLENRALWLLTANNPRLSVEIARRSVRIRINPDHARPWLRTGFRHPDLEGWVKQNRALLVTALSTLVRSWIVAGKPKGPRPLGSFESWARTLGGILEHVGVDGFLEQPARFEATDDDNAMWESFVGEWWTQYQARRVRAKQLVEFCKERDLLVAVLGDQGPRSEQTRLGNALSQQRDRVYLRYRIRVLSPEDGARGTEYALELIDTPPSAEGSPH